MDLIRSEFPMSPYRTVRSYYAKKLLSEDKSLEEIQEFCEKYSAMLSYWEPKSMNEIVAESMAETW